MKGSNCLLFAFLLYIRQRKKGNEVYISIRRSRWGSFPHFLIMRRRSNGQCRIISYIPIDPIPRKFPPIIFKGKVSWGDKPHNKTDD